MAGQSRHSRIQALSRATPIAPDAVAVPKIAAFMNPPHAHARNAIEATAISVIAGRSRSTHAQPLADGGEGVVELDVVVGVVVELEVVLEVVVELVVVVLDVVVEVVGEDVVPTSHRATVCGAGGNWKKHPPGPVIASYTLCKLPPANVFGSATPPECDCASMSHCQ